MIRAAARLALLAALLPGAPAGAAELRSVAGLVNPASAVAGHEGRIYVSEIGEFGRDGDGRITAIGKDGRLVHFATGLDDPTGLARWKHQLYVADKTRIWMIDGRGHARVFVAAKDFPEPPRRLDAVAFDSRGNLYVADVGEAAAGGPGVIYKVSPEGKVTRVIGQREDARVRKPHGLAFERPGRLLALDAASGELLRIDVAKRTVERLAGGFSGGRGLVRDGAGRLYVADQHGGRIWKLDARRSNAQPEAYAATFRAPADIGLDASGKFILVPDTQAGTLTWLPR